MIMKCSLHLCTINTLEMKMFKNSIRPVKWLSATLFAALIMTFPLVMHAQKSPKVKNIILVHGAFADGSGWEGVYRILAAKGYDWMMMLPR
jgi:hypothetical protein